jgi:hypothetical protein
LGGNGAESGRSWGGATRSFKRKNPKKQVWDGALEAFRGVDSENASEISHRAKKKKPKTPKTKKCYVLLITGPRRSLGFWEFIDKFLWKVSFGAVLLRVGCLTGSWGEWILFFLSFLNRISRTHARTKQRKHYLN